MTFGFTIFLALALVAIIHLVKRLRQKKQGLPAASQELALQHFSLTAQYTFDSIVHELEKVRTFKLLTIAYASEATPTIAVEWQNGSRDLTLTENLKVLLNKLQEEIIGENPKALPMTVDAFHSRNGVKATVTMAN